MLQQVTNFARHMNKNNYFTRNAYLKGSFEIFKDVGTLIFTKLQHQLLKTMTNYKVHSQ